jgi:hypothetical protein
LRETTEWLRLPLQPTTSNSGALLTFAHCPNFKLQAAQLGRLRTVGTGLSDHSGLFLKVSNFEQTIAVHICCFGNHRGIALSGPNPTPPSIIGLVALYFPGCSNSLTFRK